jgi:hypothetical protein
MKWSVCIAAFAAVALLVVVPAASPASGHDYKGPKCLNITGGGGGYPGTAGGTATVDFTVQYAAPVCADATYSFFVTDQQGHLLATGTSDTNCIAEPATGGCLHFVAAVTNAPSTVCVYTTTSPKNGNSSDYAPDTRDPTCSGPTPELSIAIGTAPGAGIFR